MAPDAETRSSLILVTNCILISAFVCSYLIFHRYSFVSVFFVALQHFGITLVIFTF